MDALSAVVDELGDAGGLLVTRAGKGHLHGDDVVRVEAGLDHAQSDESADEQAGADDEDEGEADLGDDEEGARLALTQSETAAAAAFIHGGGKVRPRRSESGDETEEDSGENRDADGEQRDAPVDGDAGAVFADAGDVAGADGEQPTHAAESEAESKNPAHEAEENTFGEQLADHPNSSGSHGGADGEFALAAGSAHHQQVGHV